MNDALFEQAREITARRQQGQLQATPADAPPPPYSNASDINDDNDQDDSDDDDANSTNETELKVTVNAAHNIRGNNNIVPTTPTTSNFATALSTAFLAALRQGPGAESASSSSSPHASSPSSSSRRRSNKIHLTINCGITVIGAGNVIGNVGLKPKAPLISAANAPGIAGSGMDGNAVQGAKRKAEDDGDDGPEAKRMAGHGNGRRD